MILIVLLIILIILFLLWRIYFLRDPIRKIPTDNVLVAPADGYIVYVNQVIEGKIFSEKAKRFISWDHVPSLKNNMSGILIGIFMPINAVHRNRIPEAGIVKKIYHQNGVNRSMIAIQSKLFLKQTVDSSDFAALDTNEKCTLQINTQNGDLYVTQIAGKGVDRIVLFVKEGEPVKTGQQYGMIRFGSQCDLFIPAGYPIIDIVIKPGDYVYAGKSIISRLHTVV